MGPNLWRWKKGTSSVPGVSKSLSLISVPVEAAAEGMTPSPPEAACTQYIYGEMQKICTSSAKSPHSVAGRYVIWHTLRCELGDEYYIQSAH